VVNGFKEPFDVALKSEARFKIITAYLSYCFIQNIYPLVGPFVNATREGIRDKRRLEYRIENGKNSMMKYAVPDSGLMNMPLFRVVNIKGHIVSVFISAAFQVPMELKNIFLELPFKQLNIPFLLLITFELVP